MTAAAIYCRISDDRTGKGLGVERQEAECRALAERLGFVVSEVYVDNDISAYSGKNRPEFERLLRDNPQRVVVWHIDRLVRLTKELERVIESGMDVYAVTAGQFDLSTPAGKAVAKTVTAWAQYESEQKGERQRSAERQRAEAGKHHWRTRPFGYNLDGTPLEAEAALIRKAAVDIIAGRSLKAIAREWNDAGALTPVIGKRGGKAWTGQMVRENVRHPRNAAIATHNGEVVGKGTWTPILTEDTHRAVTDTFAVRATGVARHRTHLLTGVAKCAWCGGSVVFFANQSTGGKRYGYYRCSRVNHNSFKVAVADNAVLERTVSLLVMPGARETLLETDRPDAEALRIERASLMHRRDVELPEGLAAGLSVAQVATATKTLNVRLEEINNALMDRTRADVFGDWWIEGDDEDISAEVERFQGLPLDTRQAFINALWAEIRLDNKTGQVAFEPTDLAVAILTPYVEHVAAAVRPTL